MEVYELETKKDNSIELVSQLFHLVWSFDDFDRIYNKTKWAFDNDFSRVLVCEDNDKLIAVRGGIYWPLTIGDLEIDSIQFHGTCVHPDYRRKGIFTSINKAYLKKVSEEKVDLIFNVSVDNSRVGYEKLGWKYIKGFRRLTYFRKPLKKFFGNKVEKNEIGSSLIFSCEKKIEIPKKFLEKRNDRLKGTIFCKYTSEFIDWRLSNVYESYKKVQLEDGLIIYKVKVRGNIKEVVIGECFLLDYHFKAFSRIVDFLMKEEKPEIVYTYIFKDHPCYNFFLRKLFLPNPKRLNLNFGTKILNSNLEEDLNKAKWGISFLDIDTF